LEAILTSIRKSDEIFEIEKRNIEEELIGETGDAIDEFLLGD
jgi:hypothetical protein